MAILRPGIYNDVNIQRSTIKMVVRSLGPDIWNALTPRRPISIIPHLQEAKDKCLPTASTRTIPRWFNHYGKYGDVPAVTRRLKIRQRRMKGGYRNSMTQSIFINSTRQPNK
jgi:hypothetical protein